jgi:hypothetical protein
MTNPLEPKLQYLGMDLLKEASGIDVCLAKVEIGLKEGNWPVLEAHTENKSADIGAQESGKFGYVMPSCQVVVPTNVVDQDSS